MSMRTKQYTHVEFTLTTKCFFQENELKQNGFKYSLFHTDDDMVGLYKVSNL